MRIFNKKTLLQFGRKYPDADQPLRTWYSEVAAASWGSPADIKDHYAHASLIGGKRVVFNIGGNKYRLVTEVDYTKQSVFLKFVGTHKQYDKVDAETVQWNPKS